MPRQSVIIRHNVEMGHRLSMQPDSKCFQLHGHSWWVELEIAGEVREDGMVINFADVKKPWREYLDSGFDHHLCLNQEDPLIANLMFAGMYNTGIQVQSGVDLDGHSHFVTEQSYEETLHAWGIVTIDCDPTVENMARIWGERAMRMFAEHVTDPEFKINVQEAATNRATWQTGNRLDGQ